ncbi:hypothetical protein DACRYDRAFT_32480, partial [Dacryopinax primogenitus]
QLHTCNIDMCLHPDKHRNLKCKQRVTFPISTTECITETGTWGILRRNSYLNNWNPSVARMMRCNHNIKLQTNGHKTKDTMWYCTCYALKKQRKSYKATGILAQWMVYH